MQPSWKDSIYLQREQLARLLRDPLARLAEKCAPVWGERGQLNAVLLGGFASIPHCTSLYCVGTDGVQICDNVGQSRLVPGDFGRDRSQRPYMEETVPNWGFLLSDAYISMLKQRPSLTALQIVGTDTHALGDPDICLVYPPQPYPPDAVIPVQDVARILDTLRALRMADENIYLRMSSINIFNGMISHTFSCDGTHYMRYDEFLSKSIPFWFGTAA
jgi:hypothetical protein